MSNSPESRNRTLEMRFVKDVIQQHLQERWFDALVSPKRRGKILHRLAGGEDLRTEFVYSVHGKTLMSKNTSLDIFQEELFVQSLVQKELQDR